MYLTQPIPAATAQSPAMAAMRMRAGDVLRVAVPAGCAPGELFRTVLILVAVSLGTATVPAAAAAQADPPPAPAPIGDPPPQLVTAVHVHSTASSGNETLAQLVGRARAAGLDGLVLTENLGYEFRYAPGPLRYLGEARLSTPTLEAHGIARYLEELEQARGEASDFVLLDGVEVPPYYYWTGSLLRGDLTMHDMQRNVLVLTPPGDVAERQRFLRDLPTVGNRHHRRYGVRSLGLLLPGLVLVGYAVRALRHGGRRRTRARTALLLATAAAGIVLLAVNYPYAVPRIEPYGDAGHRPVQDLFDYVDRHDGLAFWSMPEAVDYHDRGIGPVRVRLSTPPYPEALIETRGYTGFGGVYADTTAVWEVGGPWDVTLAQFLDGERRGPPWIVGESAYHYAGQAGKQLDDILTVLSVEERSATAAFEALAAGRAYALRRDQGSPDLRLDELALTPAGGGDHGAASVARAGDTLMVAGDEPVDVDLVVQVDDTTAAGTAVRIEVVRNGALQRTLDATTPVNARWTETLAAGEAAAYFRVIVRAARPAHLVSNPVFVRRRATVAGR